MECKLIIWFNFTSLQLHFYRIWALLVATSKHVKNGRSQEHLDFPSLWLFKLVSELDPIPPLLSFTIKLSLVKWERGVGLASQTMNQQTLIMAINEGADTGGLWGL